MSIIQGAALGGSAYQIANSVRFRSAAGAYLSRTFNTPTNSNVFTYSAFIKRGSLGGTFRLLGASTTTYLTFNSSDQINLTLNGVSAATSTAVFRDTSAHYHVVYQQNGASQTIWVNSVVVATGTTASAVFNTAIVHQIGAANTANFFDGYLSEINFIDGQALTPSSFGEFSAEHGQWVPKKYTGTYGTNGFYLPFNDGSNLTNLTADRSGNENNWTANNISLTSGSSYDWMDDTPTNNFAVLNPLDVSPTESSGRAQVLDGNLRLVGGNQFARGWQIPNSGQWYWEITLLDLYAGAPPDIWGDHGVSSSGVTNVTGVRLWANTTGGIVQDGTKVQTFSAWANNDVIGFEYDAATRSMSVYRNGTQLGTSVTANATDKYVYSFLNGTADTSSVAYNFGQRPFAYTPPAGFKALCTKNLPTPSILNPKKHFDVVLATGANIKSTAEAVFPSNFLELIKDRGNANNHQLIDIVRGTSAVLQSNTTAAETTYSAPSGSSVGWLWKAGGAPVTNNAGSIQSQVSANPQAGFSIVTYTGTGANATVGHGLGVAPGLIIQKPRTNSGSANNWQVYHKSAQASGAYVLYLNTTSAATNSSTYWQNTAPTSSVFSVGTHLDTNGTVPHVAYCFAEVPGFSKIGSYTGNGSADGPFVYCGFRPRFVMVKRSDADQSNWTIHDTAREAANVQQAVLYPHLSNAEAAQSALDVLSSGFKLRHSTAEQNGSGGTYIFMAFAEAPFKYANAR